MAHTRLEDQLDIVVAQCPPTHLCSTLPYGWSMIRKPVRMKSPQCKCDSKYLPYQANLETLRTRVGQIADLRNAQGLREGQRALTARLTEVEECTSVQTLREFVHRILRLEALFCGNHGGIIGEAIRACNLRLDSHIEP